MDILAWSLIPGAIQYDKDKVQTSPSDRMAEVMAELDDFQRARMFYRARIEKEREQIANMCAACGTLTEKEQTVISSHYIDLIDWGEIAEQIEVTDRRVLQLHGSAIEKLEAFLGAEVDKM